MAIPLGPGDPALGPALGGVMRGGVGRAGVVDGRVYLKVNGQHVGWGRDADEGTLLGSLTITDTLDETPNRCTFRVNGYVPPTGAEVILTLGSKNRMERLFAGFALTVDQVYAGVPANVQADVAAVDYTWLLGFVKVTAQYRSQSASVIVQDLIATYGAANGFTARHVVAGLPILDEITFTEEDLTTAITRTMRRVGAYWYVDYFRDVHCFLTEVGNGAPRPLTPAHPSLTAFTRQADRTQALARVYCEGRGSRLLASINPGDDRIPLESVDMFAAVADVFVKASFQGAEGGAQHLNFAGVVVGGAGTLVGPGNAPGTGPGPLSVLLGGAVDTGAHSYAYTWVNAAGETKPSAATAVSVTGSIATPAQIPQLAYDPGTSVAPPAYWSGAWAPGDWVEFAYSYSAHPQNNFDKAYETPLSPLHGATAIASPYHQAGTPPGSNSQGFILYPYHSADPNVKFIRPWHRVNGGPWREWNAPTIGNNPGLAGATSSCYLQQTYQSQNATPASATPGLRTVQIAGIATGPSGITARKLYRTKAGLSALLLVATIADNTTTTYTDAAADTALGAAPPANDTTGLPQPTGQVPPGVTSIVVASTAPFRSDGGWVIIGNGDQVIRYTGIGAGTIVGIPPTGAGAVVATVVYNTTITAASMLIGIPSSGSRSIRRALTAGDEIYLVVVRENEATRGGLQGMGAGNGWREEWVQDRRLSIAEARARAQATLAAWPLDATSISYRCRDLLTQSGKTIAVNLPAPTNVVGDFKIQQVTISNFRPRAGQQPTYAVQASSARFSFEDLLNRFRVKE